MKKYTFFLAACISLFFFQSMQVSAAIDFTFSPIKYELTVATGSSLSRTASLKNNGSESVTIITGKSDFQSNGTSGIPSFVRRSELVYQNQELSSWITLDTTEFTLLPGEEKIINFTIDVPADASPGGHYGAVFFKRPSSEVSTSGNIGINVDYGVLILLNVEGEVNIGGEIPVEEITVGGGTRGGSGGGTNVDTSWISFFLGETYDNCRFGDFSKSNFDEKCFDNPFNPKTPENNTIKTSPEKEKDLNVTFEIPFKNVGNTHIKPLGKIVLKDEDGLELKAIGKESIINELGANVGEKIVDYIPINDGGGNVLPQTKRVFETQWKGFPYKSIDTDGNEVIQYFSPSEYYTKKNISDDNFLMFWERVCEARRNKTITALINVSYKDQTGKDIEFNSAKEIEIEYVEKYIGINPYIFISLLFPLLILGLWFGKYILFIVIKRKRKCPHCKKEIKKEWSVCPHCEREIHKQKSKKKK